MRKIISLNPFKDSCFLKKHTEHYFYTMNLTKIKNMMLAMVPSFVYFLITFQLLAITKGLILKEYSIDVTSVSSATIMAFILAKVVLIVDEIE